MAWPRRFLRGVLLVLLSCSLVERSLLVLAWTGSVSRNARGLFLARSSVPFLGLSCLDSFWSVLGSFFGSFPGTFFAWTLSGPFFVRSLRWPVPLDGMLVASS